MPSVAWHIAIGQTRSAPGRGALEEGGKMVAPVGFEPTKDAGFEPAAYAVLLRGHLSGAARICRSDKRGHLSVIGESPPTRTEIA